MSEQRHFQRVSFDTNALVSHAGHGHYCQLVDIALQGALLDAPDGLPLRSGDCCSLSIFLPSADQSLEFEGQLVHQENHRYGFRFVREDDNSMAHLRRLLELNTGSGDLVDGEVEYWLKH